MHPLAAELLAEDLGMLLNGEQEYLLESFLGHYRVPVTGQRQPALVAEISQRMEVLADALLLLERDPISAGLEATAVTPSGKERNRRPPQPFLWLPLSSA
jgi:hypothetical protein